MSAFGKQPEQEGSTKPPVEAYDLWRARRDLERYIFDHTAANGPIAPELGRLRDFLRQLAGED